MTYCLASLPSGAVGTATATLAEHNSLAAHGRLLQRTRAAQIRRILMTLGLTSPGGAAPSATPGAAPAGRSAGPGEPPRRPQATGGTVSCKP